MGPSQIYVLTLNITQFDSFDLDLYLQGYTSDPKKLLLYTHLIHKCPKYDQFTYKMLALQDMYKDV